MSLTLAHVKAVRAVYYSFDSSTGALREFLRRANVAKLRDTNPKCTFLADVQSAPVPPTLHFEYSELQQETQGKRINVSAGRGRGWGKGARGVGECRITSGSRHERSPVRSWTILAKHKPECALNSSCLFFALRNFLCVSSYPPPSPCSRRFLRNGGHQERPGSRPASATNTKKSHGTTVICL